VVFVPLGAPGDLVEVDVQERHRTWDRARLVRVLEPGPDRVDPPCAHFGDCGGCQWQHVSYEAQRIAKQRILRSALRRLAPDVEVEAAESPYGYRRRVRVHHRGGEVGFLARRSHRLVPVDRCLLLEPALQDALDRARPELRGDGETALCAKDDLADAGEPAFRIEAGVFAQVGDAADRRLRAAVIAEVRGPRVLELYAGAGNFTRLLAAHDVTAVESDARAADLLRLNAPAARVIAARCGPVVADLAAGGARFDTVLLDPPRQGAADVVAGLASLAPARILYVSCDPMTLARDAERLAALGWAVVRARGFDTTPQTTHLEALLVFDRRDRAHGS
jgi:23S rRNA (uracil1939-C5)-methyltransferase